MATLALLAAVAPATGARADDASADDASAGLRLRLDRPAPARRLVAVPRLALDPAYSSVGPLGVPYEHHSTSEIIAARTTLACLGAFVFPGLGQAAIGAYYPKGLAFTGGFVASIAGVVSFAAIGIDGRGNVRGPALIGMVTLAAIADVIYIWSIIDALADAATVPTGTPGGGPTPLGAR